MLKQYLSIFFLTLSTLMMLGHSIIPHHHHSHLEDSIFHSINLPVYQSESNHHDGHLDNLFSLIPHGQKGVECISCPNIDEKFNKQNFTFIAIFPRYFEIIFPLILSENDFFDYYDTLLTSSYFPPGGLRAPPFFF